MGMLSFREGNALSLKGFGKPWPMLFGNDPPNATVRPAAARMVFKFIKVISVVITQLFPFGNVPQRCDPNPPADHICFTIWVAGMVNIFGCIIADVAVDVMPVVEFEDINSTPLNIAPG